MVQRASGGILSSEVLVWCGAPVVWRVRCLPGARRAPRRRFWAPFASCGSWRKLLLNCLARNQARSACSRMHLLVGPFQVPLEALQCGSSLISPNRWLTVVAVAGVHQDADGLKFLLDQAEIVT